MKTGVKDILDKISLPVIWHHAALNVTGFNPQYLQIRLFKGYLSRWGYRLMGEYVAEVRITLSSCRANFCDPSTLEGLPRDGDGNPDWDKAVYDRRGMLVQVPEIAD